MERGHDVGDCALDEHAVDHAEAFAGAGKGVKGFEDESVGGVSMEEWWAYCDERWERGASCMNVDVVELGVGAGAGAGRGDGENGGGSVSERGYSLVLLCFLLDISNFSCYLLEVVLVVLILDLEIWRELALVSVTSHSAFGGRAYLAAAARRLDSAPYCGSSRARVYLSYLDRRSQWLVRSAKNQDLAPEIGSRTLGLVHDTSKLKHALLDACPVFLK